MLQAVGTFEVCRLARLTTGELRVVGRPKAGDVDTLTEVATVLQRVR
jgi:hypothetical protein